MTIIPWCSEARNFRGAFEGNAPRAHWNHDVSSLADQVAVSAGNLRSALPAASSATQHPLLAGHWRPRRIAAGYRCAGGYPIRGARSWRRDRFSCAAPSLPAGFDRRAEAYGPCARARGPARWLGRHPTVPQGPQDRAARRRRPASRRDPVRGADRSIATSRMFGVTTFELG